MFSGGNGFVCASDARCLRRVMRLISVVIHGWWKRVVVNLLGMCCSGCLASNKPLEVEAFLRCGVIDVVSLNIGVSHVYKAVQHPGPGSIHRMNDSQV